MAVPAAALPPETYAIFSGQINGDSVTRIVNGFTAASAQNVRHVHMMFHSTGGFVGDGIALHNIFRTLPFDLTLYNPGIVASIGVIAFLGARQRRVSPHAIFMIHRTQCIVPQGTPANRTQTIVNAAILDDQRTEAILRQYLQLPEDRWGDLENHDLHFSAEDGVEFGFAQEIADFCPPVGTRIFNV